jgi:hypothetical protein
MFYPTQKTGLKKRMITKMNRFKSNQKLRFLHAVIITFRLVLINKAIIEKYQDLFQQISLTVSQDFNAYLME